MTEIINDYSSEDGFDNKLAFVIITAIFFILIEVLGISILISSAVWEVSVFGGGAVLLVGLITINLFPSTLSIRVLKNGVEIRKKKQVEIIPYKNIKSIRASFAMIDQNFQHLEYYRIDLKTPCYFGDPIYFRKRNSSFLSSKKVAPIEKIIKKKIIESRKK